MSTPDDSVLDDDIVESMHDRLALYMERNGLRSTTQRKLVSDVFFRQRGHHSIDDLLALTRKRDGGVGHATVYRTMRLLVECGLADERHFGDSSTRFEVAQEDHHHDHLICTKCQRIVEFEDDGIETLQEAVATRHGFELVSHKHELYGICPQCAGRPEPTG